MNVVSIVIYLIRLHIVQKQHADLIGFKSLNKDTACEINTIIGNSETDFVGNITDPSVLINSENFIKYIQCPIYIHYKHGCLFKYSIYNALSVK